MLRLVALLSCLLLSACIVNVDDHYDEPDWRERQRENHARIQQLELGLGIDQVYQRMGPADITEAFVADEREYHVLRYRTQQRHGDGETTVDETTPLLFVDGRLVGWGERAVNKTLHEHGFETEADYH
ncbi:MAG: hypothetical protein Tsb002_12080 [Wenzhouxiangellaceae bacterium]